MYRNGKETNEPDGRLGTNDEGFSIFVNGENRCVDVSQGQPRTKYVETRSIRGMHHFTVIDQPTRELGVGGNIMEKEKSTAVPISVSAELRSRYTHPDV